MTHRFEFNDNIDLEQAEQTLHLTLFGVEGLFGPARVRLEVSYQLELTARVINVSGVTDVSEAVARVFTSYLSREFGEDAFRVRAVAPPTSELAGAAQ